MRLPEIDSRILFGGCQSDETSYRLPHLRGHPTKRFWRSVYLTPFPNSVNYAFPSLCQMRTLFNLLLLWDALGPICFADQTIHRRARQVLHVDDNFNDNSEKQGTVLDQEAYFWQRFMEGQSLPILTPDPEPETIDPEISSPDTEEPFTFEPTESFTSVPEVVEPPTPSLMSDIVAAQGDLSIFTAMAKETSFDQVILESSAGRTVFAPTDAAFGNFDQDILDRLQQPEWILHLRYLLFGHIAVFDILYGVNLSHGMSIQTALDLTTITVNSINGQIYLSGSYYDGVAIVETDLIADNGVVHKIGGIMPPEFLFVDIVELAGARAFLTVMRDLLASTGLDVVVKDGLYTILWPVNEAFDELPVSSLEELTDPSNEDMLREILLYHLVPGLYPTDMLTSGIELVTAQGSSVIFSVSERIDGVLERFFNDVFVITVNFAGGNGLLHAIAGVLLPP